MEHYYYTPTALFYGEGCVSEKLRCACSHTQKAFVLTTRFVDGLCNYALEDILRTLSGMRLDSFVYEDSEENPTVESIVRVARIMLASGADYIIAIGGGSALDTAKAANVLLRYPDKLDNPYELFYGGKVNHNTVDSGLLPMCAVPTTSGSGSEVMGFAILTRTDTHTKLRMNQLSYFKYAFLDPNYIRESPQWLLDAGAMDSLSHGIEGLLNRNAGPISSVWNRYGFSLFASFKDNLLSTRLTNEDFNNMQLAGSLQGMGQMHSTTTIPHGLGYSITHFKGVTHGIANAITLPSYLRCFRDKSGVNAVLSECGFSGLDEFEEYIGEIVRRNVNISVTDVELNAWAAECYSLKARTEAHPEPITQEDIRKILGRSLAGCMQNIEGGTV